MKTIASIQARMGSSRLPGKVLLSIGERRVLERVVYQCKQASNVDEVVLTVGDNPENKAITEWAERNNMKFVTEKEEDLLLRHYKVAREFDATSIVRVTADCPFIPPDEIDRLVTEHKKGEYDYTTSWANNTPIGATVGIVSRDVLNDLMEAGESHPITPIRNNPERWDINYSESEDWLPYSGVHLAVDEPEDYWNLIDAYKDRGNNPLEIAKWLKNEQDA